MEEYRKGRRQGQRIRKTGMDKVEKIELSIVIPTRNRKDKLEVLLDSLAKQKADPSKWELIVVDNGSTDNTRSLCKKWERKFRNFRYIYDERPGLHIGRNRGLKDSCGEVIAYLDDDVKLFPNWIQTGLDAFLDDKLMAANGCVIPSSIESISKQLLITKNMYFNNKGSA